MGIKMAKITKGSITRGKGNAVAMLRHIMIGKTFPEFVCTVSLTIISIISI